MEPGLLTAILGQFRDVLLPLGPELAELLHPSWYILVKLSFILLILSLLMGSSPAIVSGLLVGCLTLGFTHILILYGYLWVDGFFRGLSFVALKLGAPSPDPSGLVSWGWAISKPIFDALDNQGVWSYVTSPVLHLTFEAGAWAVYFAFVVLALMEMGYLIMSFLLCGLAPFSACGLYCL